MGQYKMPMTRGERTGLIILFILLGMILLVMFMTRRCGSDPGNQVNDSIISVTAPYDSLIVEPADSMTQKSKHRTKRKQKIKEKKTEPERDFLDEKID